MKTMSIQFFIVLLAAAGQAAFVSQQASQQISPELEPTSDKKFFGKDYPFDKRAVADKHYVFDHPYPAVQDSSDFDSDFVKDENSDGGRWDAQMNYDTLRAEIGAAREKMKELKEKMEKEYEEWLRAKKDGEAADDGLAKARKEVETARNAAEAAAGKVNDLEGGSQKDGTKAGGAIGRAIEDVQKEMDDLEKCKETLAKAKEKLKELIKQREASEKAEAVAKKTEQEAKKQAEEEEAKAKEKKEKETEETEKKKADEKKKTKKDQSEEKNTNKKKDNENDEEARKEIEETTEKSSDARKDYLEELEDVRRTEKELEEAAKNLRKFRRPPYVDDNGGVYNVPSDSLARVTSAPVACLMMALAVISATFA